MSETTVSNKDTQQHEQLYHSSVEFLNNLESVKKFIQSRLHQYKLEGQYNPDDIINEVFLRWHKAVEEGKQVPVLAGWMRVTAHNIIRELKRKNERADLYEPSVLAELVPDTQKAADNEQHQFVRQALQLLSPEKRELLEFRFFQNLSWDDITNIYATRGQKTTAQTLRKRKQRAMDELRKVYLNIFEDK